MTKQAQLHFRLTAAEKNSFKLLCAIAGYRPAEVMRRFVEGRLHESSKTELPENAIKDFMYDGRT